MPAARRASDEETETAPPPSFCPLAPPPPFPPPRSARLLFSPHKLVSLDRPRSRAVSPASTAGRIKYADPRSLPSFPSSGLAPGGSAASAAATFGWAAQKPVDLYKPDRAASASAAAVLAADHKMASSPASSASSDGHKAALLAVGSAGAALRRSGAAKPPAHARDTWGNSAAAQAFHVNRPALVEPPDLAHGSSATV